MKLEYRNFKVTDIFIVETGANIPQNELKSGKTPRISVTNLNNGISGYYNDLSSNNYRVQENFISFSFLGTCFYHPYKASLDMKVHSLKPIGYMLNKYTALFLVNLFKKSFNGVYNDQISSTDLKKSYIRLPVTNDMIDFNFMENYIKSIEAKMQKLILYHNALALRERERENNSPNGDVFITNSHLANYIQEAIMRIAASLFGKLNCKWDEFELANLFEILLAKGDLQAKRLQSGNNPLISSGNFNNGIVAYVQNCDELSEKFDGNSLSVDMFGKCFYQPKNFYAVSHGRINILKPKFELNQNIGFFIVSILNKSFGDRYSFNQMCSQTALKKEKIALPVNGNGNPNFTLMENFIKEIKQNHTQKLIDYYLRLADIAK